MSLLKPGLGSSHTPRVSPVPGPVLWFALGSLAAGDEHRKVDLLPGVFQGSSSSSVSGRTPSLPVVELGHIRHLGLSLYSHS